MQNFYMIISEPRAQFWQHRASVRMLSREYFRHES